jgi:hypothetical protein
MVRLGRVLVFLGVAVWPVWGILFLAGSAPNVGWALLAHLALVVPGGTLVRRGTPSEARPARQRLGTALIAFGVTAWVPYFILREQGVEVPSAPFLAWHLSGVIPGAVLRYTRWGWPRRRTSRAEGPEEAPAEGSASGGSGSATRPREPGVPPP